MASLTTIFKKVYGEALEPYGFVKLKGRQPYFVKLIGDEIILVISYRNERTGYKDHKEFDILGGVATVYRSRLTLDETPRSNSFWMDYNRGIYHRQHLFDATWEDEKYFFGFGYEAGDENSMVQAMKVSLEITKKYLLPALLSVTDLRSCAEYFYYYNGPIFHIHADENFGQRWSGFECNEGLLNLKVYTLQEYIEINKKHTERAIEHNNFLIARSNSDRQKAAFEKCKENLKEGLYESIAIFESVYNDPAQYARVMKELERRKEENLKILRSYGFEV